MRLGKYGKIFHHDRVQIGEGHIDRYTIFELKFLGGIIINIFNTTFQNRHHTHAFNAWSLMIRGWYGENILYPSIGPFKIQGWRTRKAGSLLYLPRSLNHKIGRSSKNAVSITFCGPWAKTWTETDDQGNVQLFSWGRYKFKSTIVD